MPEWQRWGGDQRVIAVFAARYAELYSGVWLQFLRLATADDRDLSPITEPVRYFFTKASTSPRRAIRRESTAPAERAAFRAPQNNAAEYHASRLTFKRDVIEALGDDDQFCVITPVGTFQMTKTDFYTTFPKILLTKSYRDAGTYNYRTVPKAAEPFRVSASAYHCTVAITSSEGSAVSHGP